jgi:hypothetical protein
MFFGLRALAIGFLALTATVLAGNTYAWFTHEASVSMVEEEEGFWSGMLPMGNVGFELEVSLEKAPPTNLYPGQKGEAIYALKNKSKTDVVFRIEGDSPDTSFLSSTENTDGFLASIYEDGKADQALFTERASNGSVDYFGYLEAGESKLIRIKFTVTENMPELKGTAEKLNISVESCEANKLGVYSYYDLDETVFESNGFWDALLQPKTVSPTPIP